ncbi:MAG: BamA/TamA family outer membrane protein, partial [Bacteroidales bacterium]|nr:BamA/TamA family outer membrane protein [Bacteroidales bacterium]
MKPYRLLSVAFLMLLWPSGMKADDSMPLDSLDQDEEVVGDEPILIAKDDGSTRISTPTEYADSLGFLNKAPEWARSYLTSLMRGNIDRTHEKRIDMGFAVTPSYTREAGFGIGGAATGLYRVNMKDSIQQPSNFFVALNASLNGFFVLTLKGDNLFPNRRSRLSYKVELYRKRLDFWGINSDETANNSKSKYDRRQIDVQAEYIYKIDKNFYFGAEFRADYTDARNMANPEYLLEERPQYYVTGVGLSFEFDSRDNLLTPTRGIHVAYRPMLYPKFAGNAPASFHSHNIVINAYFGTWKGCLVALDFYTKLN